MAYFNGDTFLVFEWNPIVAFVHKRDLSYVVPLFNPFISTWLIFSDLVADLFMLYKIFKIFFNYLNCVK